MDMIRTVGYPVLVRPNEGAHASGFGWIARWVGAALLILLALVVVAGYLAERVWSPGLAVGLPDGSTDVPLDSTVAVRPLGWGGRVEQASLVALSAREAAQPIQ